MADASAPAKRSDPKKSDLGVRTLSAVGMVMVAGGALWLGGWAWTAFVVLVAAGVYAEWTGIVRKFARGGRQLAWLLGGALYVGIAAVALAGLRQDVPNSVILFMIVAGVIGTDIGAYFAGRAIGGPKIAPKISPSKTWAGLGGGIIGASLAIEGIIALLPQPWFANMLAHKHEQNQFVIIEPIGGMSAIVLVGAVLAVAAQAGDFFESWMKRRAGLKDSGRLLPGHGGLFDRTDGLIAVSFLFALPFVAILIHALLTGAPLLPEPA